MLAISVLHAISDAVASVADHRFCPRLDAPATPERVLEAIDAPARACGMSERAGPASCATCWRRRAGGAGRGRRGQGLTPREAGAAMLVTAERSFGTIGGGRLEWEASARARELLADGQASSARWSCRWARPWASAAAAM